MTIVKKEEQISALESQKQNAAARIDELQEERSTLVVPARAEGNTSARGRLGRIDQEIAKLRRDNTDDDAAIALLAKEIESLREQMASEAVALKLGELCELVTIAAERATENFEAASRLIENAKELRTQFAKIGRLLPLFPSFPDLAINPRNVEILDWLHAEFEGTHAEARNYAALAKLFRLSCSLQKLKCNVATAQQYLTDEVLQPAAQV